MAVETVAEKKWVEDNIVS
ncbi:hypothetical protein R5R35_007774 [Gryllus longicercus]|uniref:Uncharacterized protein n=1 Tax=Gryllus longicercus TaxID=2509291 RepID=A0AAN9ZA87_9ORTH